MPKLNFNSPEVHEDWIIELRKTRNKNYGDSIELADAIAINRLDSFWFFKGCPVEETVFNKICEALDFDPLAVQNPK